MEAEGIDERDTRARGEREREPSAHEKKKKKRKRKKKREPWGRGGRLLSSPAVEEERPRAREKP